MCVCVCLWVFVIRLVFGKFASVNTYLLKYVHIIFHVWYFYILRQVRIININIQYLY